MIEFRTEIDNRIRAALASLQQARAEADDYLVDIRLGELDSLQRLAAENGIELDANLTSETPIDLREEQPLVAG